MTGRGPWGRFTVCSGMSSFVMLRWVVPVRHPYASARDLIKGLVSPAVRAGGWLSSPGTTHHVSDEGSEAWVTVVTTVDDATAVEDDLTERLMSPPAVESARDALLDPDVEWYRAALQDVTHVGLDVIDARSPIPLTEYGAFLSPSQAAPILVPFLNEVSDTYRRACSTYEATESFWLAFFRRGPAADLDPSGHRLWNLAG